MFDLLFVLLVICVISVPFSHVALNRIQRENPEVMRASGVVAVDWWPICIRGVFLLGFTSVGASLSRLRRVLFRLTITAYVVIPLYVLLTLYCKNP